MTVEGSQLTVNVDAQATEGPLHAQHIHGFANDASSCPTAAADTSGNGRISVGEGASSYGGILVPLDGSLDSAEGLGDLDTFPTGGSDGDYSYERTIMTGDLDVNKDQSFEDLSLANYAIVMHGRTVEGEYAPKLPVACVTLAR